MFNGLWMLSVTYAHKNASSRLRLTIFSIPIPKLGKKDEQRNWKASVDFQTVIHILINERN